MPYQPRSRSNSSGLIILFTALIAIAGSCCLLFFVLVKESKPSGPMGKAEEPKGLRPASTAMVGEQPKKDVLKKEKPGNQNGSPGTKPKGEQEKKEQAKQDEIAKILKEQNGTQAEIEKERQRLEELDRQIALQKEAARQWGSMDSIQRMTVLDSMRRFKANGRKGVADEEIVILLDCLTTRDFVRKELEKTPVPKDFQIAEKMDPKRKAELEKEMAWQWGAMSEVDQQVIINAFSRFKRDARQGVTPEEFRMLQRFAGTRDFVRKQLENTPVPNIP